MIFIVFLPFGLALAAAGELLRAKALQAEGSEYKAVALQAAGLILLTIACVVLLGAAFYNIVQSF